MNLHKIVHHLLSEAWWWRHHVKSYAVLIFFKRDFFLPLTSILWAVVYKFIMQKFKQGEYIYTVFGAPPSRRY